MNFGLQKQKHEIEQLLMNEITSYDPMPASSEDYLESEQYKILRNYLAFEKNSIEDFIPINQWKNVLRDFLPDPIKYLAEEVKLVDFPLKAVMDYNKIQDEFYANVNTIHRLALKFIEIKNKGEIYMEPIQVANVLKHLAEGILAETAKFQFYKSNREKKLKIVL